MRLIIKNSNDFVVLIYKDNINKIDFNDKNELERYFEELFFKIKKRYDLEVSGFYKINIYIDEIYGVIITVCKDENEYFDYINSVDMQISKPINISFLYKIKDLFLIDKNIYNKIHIYYYRNNYYIKIIEKIKYCDYIKLIELSDIVYENIDYILKNSKKLEV